MNIEEIALRVAADQPWPTSGEHGKQVVKFARALVAELNKDAVPVAWGIAVEGEMCDAYIIKDTCVREFDRRNRLYPDTPRVLVELFPHQANTEASLAAVCEQGKRDAAVNREKGVENGNAP